MKKLKRKGFTLAELLIVIVVIGILSAMMMYSSSEAIATARATQIIADMRTLKVAALAFFADNFDKYDSMVLTGDDNKIKALGIREGVLKYIGAHEKNLDRYAPYKIMGEKDNEENKGKKGDWFVEFCLTNKNFKNTTTSGLTESDLLRLRKKLADRAKSAGLLADRKVDSVIYDGKSGDSRGGNVFMLVK